jgi:hypothetical protein
MLVKHGRRKDKGRARETRSAQREIIPFAIWVVKLTRWESESPPAIGGQAAEVLPRPSEERDTKS